MRYAREAHSTGQEVDRYMHQIFEKEKGCDLEKSGGTLLLTALAPERRQRRQPSCYRHPCCSCGRHRRRGCQSGRRRCGPRPAQMAHREGRNEA